MSWKRSVVEEARLDFLGEYGQTTAFLYDLGLIWTPSRSMLVRDFVNHVTIPFLQVITTCTTRSGVIHFGRHNPTEPTSTQLQSNSPFPKQSSRLLLAAF